jgi:serine phosphatase RsbU (regulator of sigma subunit)
MSGISGKPAIVAVLGAIAVVTLLRLLTAEVGPLYLLPVVLAGLWLGATAGLAAGIVGALLSTVTAESTELLEFATPVRVAIYGGIGWIVGTLAASQAQLARELTRKDLELEEVHTMQEALAPASPPKRPALELATCYIPAEQGVSGDFFLVEPAAGDATVIAVGDVAGRGLEAAKRAWNVRTLLATSSELSDDPAEMLERANRALVAEAGFNSPFVTVACVLYRPDGRIDWALAGHDDPISLEDGTAFLGNGNRGLPLGIADRLGCETSSARLDGGSGCLLYTDGLTEARRSTNGSPAGVELFGEDRLASLVAKLESSSPADVVERVQDEVTRFTGGELADDLCLVALRAALKPETTEVC